MIKQNFKRNKQNLFSAYSLVKFEINLRDNFSNLKTQNSKNMRFLANE